jgi:HSP20 family protein
MSLIPWKNKQQEGGGGEASPLVALRGEMDRLFDAFFREPFGALDWPLRGSDRWTPAIDASEDEKEFTVRAELPGMDAKDLDVTVTGNQLVISGEKKETSEHDGKDFYRKEIRSGSFRRVMPLPEGVDTENVDAEYSNGVLTLHLKKTAPTPQKRIEVKVK